MRVFLKGSLFAVSLIASGAVFAGVDTETDENGIILAGHDAVAYFTEGKPVLGKATNTHPRTAAFVPTVQRLVRNSK